MNTKLHSDKGFTLVELIVAVAIVAILASVALPSYQRYVIRANRADAQQTLLQASQAAERYFVAENKYTGFTVTGGISQSPATGVAIYNISVDSAGSSSFSLKATPVATKKNKSDGFLQIDSQGLRGWDKNNDGALATDEYAWK